MQMDLTQEEIDMVLKNRKENDQNQESIRSALISFRAKENLSQKKFAKMAGISHVTINHFENGANVTNMTLAKIKLFIK